jgi:hypothetical protein
MDYVPYIIFNGNNFDSFKYRMESLFESEETLQIVTGERTEQAITNQDDLNIRIYAIGNLPVIFIKIYYQKHQKVTEVL